jgi:hypothetical protein
MEDTEKAPKELKEFKENIFKVSMVPTGSDYHQNCHMCKNPIPPHVKLREIVTTIGKTGKEEHNIICPNCDYILSDTYLALMARRFAVIRTSAANYWTRYCSKKPMEWQ